MVLESPRSAAARGAAILGTLVGSAMNADAFNLMSPAVYGTGAQKCMRLALESAGIAPDEIGHVNAHGTATRANDQSEASAISTVFGSVPTTATKGVLGHCMGASGAIEAIVTLLALRHRLVPPTASTTDVPASFAMDLVQGVPRPVSSGYGLSNSFALGGQNVSLVLHAEPDDAQDSALHQPYEADSMGRTMR
jgi:3-oxoacyl-[acyl-carrier-protein] synthase II